MDNHNFVILFVRAVLHNADTWLKLLGKLKVDPARFVTTNVNHVMEELSSTPVYSQVGPPAHALTIVRYRAVLHEYIF